MDGQMDGWGGLANEWTKQWIYECMNGWIGSWMNIWTDGWILHVLAFLEFSVLLVASPPLG